MRVRHRFDVLEHPVDAFAHLLEGEAVAIRRRHVQKLDACFAQRLGSSRASRRQSTTAVTPRCLQAFDLALAERTADSQLGVMSE